MNNSYITIIKEKRTALSRKRIPLNQNECTADFRIGVPFEQNLHTLSTLKKKLNSAQILILDEFGYVPYDRNGSQLLFDYLSEIHEQKSVILNTNLEFSQWVNVLYDQRMTTALIGRLTHHVELILFPGVNNRLRESSINETLSKINSQNG